MNQPFLPSGGLPRAFPAPPDRPDAPRLELERAARDAAAQGQAERAMSFLSQHAAAFPEPPGLGRALAKDCLFAASDARDASLCARISSLLASDPFGRDAALLSAARDGRALALQALLDAGADPAATENQDFNALICAAQAGNAECVRLLLPVSDPNQVDDEGGHALMWAASREHARECLPLLLPVSDISLRDAEGLNALGWAVRMNQAWAIEALLRRCEPADILERGAAEGSAFEMAEEKLRSGFPEPLALIGAWLARREALQLEATLKGAGPGGAIGQQSQPGDCAASSEPRRPARRM